MQARSDFRAKKIGRTWAVVDPNGNIIEGGFFDRTIAENMAKEYHKQQQEHRGSKRVGPVINDKGFLLPSMVIIIAGIIYTTVLGWLFIYDHRDPSPVQFRDEQYDPFAR